MKQILSALILLVIAVTTLPAQVYFSRAEFNRKDSVLAYSAGDVIGPDTTTGARNLLAFHTGLRSGGYGGVIRALKLTVDSANTTNATFRIYFYSDSTGSGKFLDNGAFVRTIKEDSLIFGYADIAALNVTGTGSGTTTATAYSPNLYIPIRTTSSGEIYARIVVTGAWVAPSRSKKIRLELYSTEN